MRLGVMARILTVAPWVLWVVRHVGARGSESAHDGDSTGERTHSAPARRSKPIKLSEQTPASGLDVRGDFFRSAEFSTHGGNLDAPNAPASRRPDCIGFGRGDLIGFGPGSGAQHRHPATIPNAAAARPVTAPQMAPYAYGMNQGTYGANQPPMPIQGGAAQLPPTYLYQPGYPYLNAPLYPSPQPYVPPEVGSTVITNQALSPHEMLYKHQYHAMYPPFYYKVNGRWIVSRNGLLTRETWKLQGTEVKVKYHSHISPFALFCPPVSTFHHYHQ